MPKSKRAPALFELINTRANGKASDKLALPKWFKTTPAAQDRPPASAESPARPAIPTAPAARPAAPPIEKKVSPPRPPAKSATDSDGSAVRIRTGRLELSLNPANAVIAGGVLVLALVFTYLLGQAMSSRSKPGMQLAGGSASVDDVRQALHQPANGQVLEPPRETPLMIATRSPANQEPRSASETGKPDKNQNLAGGATDGSGGSGGPNRIVIESFKTEAEDVKAAKHIREWLAAQYGLRTELRQFGDRIWLVTQDGFDLDQPGQKEAMNKMIEDLKSLGGTCARELASQKLPVYRLASPYPRRLEK